MNQVATIGHFKIYHADDGYVVHNPTMDGYAHSHISNIKSARWVFNLSMHKRVPNRMPKYLLISLLRVNNDEDYCRKIQDMISAKSKKKDMYFNSNKGVRKK